MNHNPMDLTGMRVLITGASSGIGRACAIEASRLGAHVVLVARREEALRETLAKMTHPEKHQCCVFDLTDIDRMDKLFEIAVQKGKLSGVVYAAGVCPATPIAFQSVSEMYTAFTVNVLAFLAMAKCFSKRKYMEEGSVVAVSSVAAVAGWAGVSVYSGTKGALSASVRSLAVELAPRRIRLNAVQPSNIKTPMFDTVAGELNDDRGMDELLRKQPLGIGQPEDVAHAVCFLLSPAARFITGSNLVVDGGYLAQ